MIFLENASQALFVVTGGERTHPKPIWLSEAVPWEERLLFVCSLFRELKCIFQHVYHSTPKGFYLLTCEYCVSVRKHRRLNNTSSFSPPSCFHELQTERHVTRSLFLWVSPISSFADSAAEAGLIVFWSAFAERSRAPQEASCCCDVLWMILNGCIDPTRQRIKL